MGVSVNSKIDALGSSGVGVVTSVGASHGNIATGDQVFVVGSGLWTTSVNVAADNAVKIPQMKAEEAALLPSFISAYAMLQGARSGDTVVHAGPASSVQHALGQIAQQKGVTFVSISESEALADSKSLSARLQSVGKVKLAITNVSGWTATTLLKSLSFGGTLFVHNGYGTGETGDSVDIPVSAAIFQKANIAGFDLLSWSRSNNKEFKAATAAVAELLASRKVSSLDARVFSHNDVSKAVGELSKGGSSGIVITF
jgi:NADPH:quinone reductase-like Zn-dependent oxidoreductase